MPRRRRGTRISDPYARNVAGRLCYAAAAEAFDKVYGSTSLERMLGFTPASRVQRQTPSHVKVDSEVRPKRALPTGGCKKWLHGHVISDQTLSLIAQTNPRVANTIREARDSDLVRALSIQSSDIRLIGRQLCELSVEAFGNYLGCMALGRCNPKFALRLSTDLLQRAKNGSELTALIAIIGLDRQLSNPISVTTKQNIEAAFADALENTASTHPEVSFARDALAEYWAQRTKQPKPGAEPASHAHERSVILDFQKRRCSRPDYANSSHS